MAEKSSNAKTVIKSEFFKKLWKDKKRRPPKTLRFLKYYNWPWNLPFPRNLRTDILDKVCGLLIVNKMINTSYGIFKLSYDFNVYNGKNNRVFVRRSRNIMCNIKNEYSTDFKMTAFSKPIRFGFGKVSTFIQWKETYMKHHMTVW